MERGCKSNDSLADGYNQGIKLKQEFYNQQYGAAPQATQPQLLDHVQDDGWEECQDEDSGTSYCYNHLTTSPSGTYPPNGPRRRK